MKTREQITATGVFPAAEWRKSSEPARLDLRARAATQAHQRDLTLTDVQPFDIVAIFGRLAEHEPGAFRFTECTADRATHVRVTAGWWAE